MTWHTDTPTTMTPTEGLETPRRAELAGSALLFSSLFKYIILHVSRHIPKEGLTFLGEIYLFLLESM